MKSTHFREYYVILLYAVVNITIVRVILSISMETIYSRVHMITDQVEQRNLETTRKEY